MRGVWGVSEEGMHVSVHIGGFLWVELLRNLGVSDGAFD